MASRKERRKDAKTAHERLKPTTGPFRHPDGDRRRRGGMTADQGIANKQEMQQFMALIPDEEPDDAESQADE